MSNPLQQWPAFAGKVRSRLEAGRAIYQDRSFSRSPGELLGEIDDELADVAAYAFILHCRLEAMRDALRNSEASDQVAKEEVMQRNSRAVAKPSTPDCKVPAGEIPINGKTCPASEPPGRLVGPERNAP
jgi:hypothetical protein